MNQKILISGSTSIAYSTFGEAANPAIIFIHGFPMTSEMWTSQVESLQEKYFVVTYDIRGFGKSISDQRYYTIETMADDLLELIDHLGLHKSTLAGFSMGGYIALHTILKKPDLFEKLILIDTQSGADGNEAKIKRHQAISKLKLHGLKIFTQDFIKGVLDQKTSDANMSLSHHLFEIAQTNTVDGLQAGLLVMLSRLDTTESLAKISVPTLVLVGENDQVTPIAVAQRLQINIPDSKIGVIANSGHFSPCENPPAVTEAIQHFLKSTS